MLVERIPEKKTRSPPPASTTIAGPVSSVAQPDWTATGEPTGLPVGAIAL